MIISSFFVKHFYGKSTGSSTGPEVPSWQGRLGFIFIGAIFILVGINSLLVEK